MKKRVPRTASSGAESPSPNLRLQPRRNELLYRGVDALDEVAQETGNSTPRVALDWRTARRSGSTIIIMRAQRTSPTPRPTAVALLLFGAFVACGTPSPSRSSPGAPDTSSKPVSPHQDSSSNSKPGVGELCTPDQGVLEGPGDCQEGLRCCMNFHGGCGGAQLSGAEREPCITSHRCAAVNQCWGPPP